MFFTIDFIFFFAIIFYTDARQIFIDGDYREDCGNDSNIEWTSGIFGPPGYCFCKNGFMLSMDKNEDKKCVCPEGKILNSTGFCACPDGYVGFSVFFNYFFVFLHFHFFKFFLYSHFVIYSSPNHMQAQTCPPISSWAIPAPGLYPAVGKSLHVAQPSKN